MNPLIWKNTLQIDIPTLHEASNFNILKIDTLRAVTHLLEKRERAKKRCSCNQFCNIGQGIEVEGHVLGFVCVCVCVCVRACAYVCVASLVCWGCTSCSQWQSYNGFEEVAQSVSSSVFLEGWRVKGLDYRVHTWCLPALMLYPMGCLFMYCFHGSEFFGAVWVPTKQLYQDCIAKYMIFS